MNVNKQQLTSRAKSLVQKVRLSGSQEIKGAKPYVKLYYNGLPNKEFTIYGEGGRPILITTKKGQIIDWIVKRLTNEIENEVQAT